MYPLLVSRHCTYPKAPSWYHESETDVDEVVNESRSAQLEKLKLTIKNLKQAQAIKKNQGVVAYAKYLLCTGIAILLSRYPLFIILAFFQLIQAVPFTSFHPSLKFLKLEANLFL